MFPDHGGSINNCLFTDNILIAFSSHDIHSWFWLLWCLIWSSLHECGGLVSRSSPNFLSLVLMMESWAWAWKQGHIWLAKPRPALKWRPDCIHVYCNLYSVQYGGQGRHTIVYGLSHVGLASGLPSYFVQMSTAKFLVGMWLRRTLQLKWALVYIGALYIVLQYVFSCLPLESARRRRTLQKLRTSPRKKHYSESSPRKPPSVSA